MYSVVSVGAALLALCAIAYALAMRMRVRALCARLHAVERRESTVLEAARILAAASRESSAAVRSALESTLRLLDPAVDTVLIFAPVGEELRCIHAAGGRGEHYSALRIARDHPAMLPARAALCGHGIALCADTVPVIPTDRAAVAVPMLAGDELVAIVYASSAQGAIANQDVIVRAVVQAASPYALASDREADRRSATYDALTGLFTPRAFRQTLQDELAAARAGRRAPLSLWFVDTDNFKNVNDTLGHAAGDVVLQRMAALVRDHTVAGIDVPARNGGDEFCAIVRGVHKTAAIERAQRLCEAVRSCDFGAGLRVTASIGVASFPSDAADAAELLEIADAAMYHSKRAGRDRVSFALDKEKFAVFA